MMIGKPGQASSRVKRNGEVYVRGELVGLLLRTHYGTRVSDYGWKFKPRAKYKKLLGTVKANTKRDVMYLILRKVREEAWQWKQPEKNT